MGARPAPIIGEVESLLVRGLEINQALVQAGAERDAWLVECDQHAPRPTNQQIATALGVTEGEVRRRIKALRGA